MALEKTMLNGRLCYFFSDRFFEYQGKRFEIVGTESTGRGAMEAIHTIKSESGETKEVTMKRLVEKLTNVSV
jgi:hypothetical protein